MADYPAPARVTSTAMSPEPLDPWDIQELMEEDIPIKQSFKDILTDKCPSLNNSYVGTERSTTRVNEEPKQYICGNTR